MLVRPITAEEYPRAREIDLIAFGATLDPDAPPEDPDLYRTVRAAFDDQGDMTACMMLPDYTIRFDGHQVPMVGIGGVASLPEHRHHGAVRAIFEAILPEMATQGTVFTVLYPFSHTYYRKFGYELCHTVGRMTLETRALENCRIPSGHFEQVKPQEDTTPLRAIYDRFTAGKNLSVVREESQWKQILRGEPFKDRTYLYLWRDQGGQARAYIKLRGVKGDDPYRKNLSVGDYAWDDPEAMAALLGFLRSMSAHYVTLNWDMPAWVNLLTSLAEPYQAKVETAPRGMARIVHVEKALGLMRYPLGEGQFTLKVRDAQVPINDGLWQVAFGPQGTSVHRAEGRIPDLELDIRALTQLVLGYLPLEGVLLARPEVKLNANGELLRQVFVSKPVYLGDFF